MSIEILLYLADVVESIGYITYFIMAVALFGVWIGCELIHRGDKDGRPIIKKAIISLVIFTIINILIPSKNTMHSMIAIKAGKQIVNNGNANELLNKTYSIINNKLDKMLSENKQ
jgi:predicted tellurium resistance membrane protein TerC